MSSAIGAGAMAGVEGEELDLGQVDADREGVVGGDAGSAQLLQEQGLQVDQIAEGAGNVEQRLAGADPTAFVVVELDVEAGIARRRHRLEPFQRQPRRGDDGAAHEHCVSDARVAEFLDDAPGQGEITVGPCRHIVRRRIGRLAGFDAGRFVHGAGSSLFRQVLLPLAGGVQRPLRAQGNAPDLVRGPAHCLEPLRANLRPKTENGTDQSLLAAAQGLHGLQGFFLAAAHGLQAPQADLAAAHGLQAPQALAAAHGLQAPHGFLAAQGLQAAAAGPASITVAAVNAGTARASPNSTGMVAVEERSVLVVLRMRVPHHLISRNGVAAMSRA
jgi:hypothetical protein